MKKIVIIILIGLAVGMATGGIVYLLSHDSRGGFHLNNLMIHGNIDRLKSFVLSFGFWAPLISSFLMIAQSVVLFLPAFPIFMVNTLAFGLGWGILLSWTSAVLGSVICFAIAKTLGRPAVRKLVNKAHLEAADAALKRYEKYIIPLFGFIPIVSFDVISYASGLTLLTYWEFVPLVCLAQIPSTLFYSLVVNKIDRGTLDVYWMIGVCLFLFLGIGSLVFRSFFNRRQRKEIHQTL